LIVVPRPFAARDVARCASQVRDRRAEAVARGAATFLQQKKNNSAGVQRNRVINTGFICTVAR
jgi:hypothetical protein